jgi:hypothetical protein
MSLHILAPSFVEGKDFRRLSVKEGKGIYRFKTLVPMIYRFSEPVISAPSRRSFRVKGKEWMYLSSKALVITTGYSWNGSSPKRGYRICGKDVWVGTPDFPETLAASLGHDVLFQFSSRIELPFDLEEANLFYLQICEQFKFKLAKTYYGALKDFSSPYWGLPEPDQTVEEL